MGKNIEDIITVLNAEIVKCNEYLQLKNDGGQTHRKGLTEKEFTTFKKKYAK